MEGLRESGRGSVHLLGAGRAEAETSEYVCPTCDEDERKLNYSFCQSTTH